jgi:hypothetical protein
LSQDSKVRLCEDYQLKNYQSFSEKEKIKVFLVLGLFDTPSNPRYIYVIPIEQIRSHIIEFNDLERYLRRKPVSQQFFFNPESGMLS